AAVCINRVLFRSSTLVDAKAICEMARRAGAWSIVDDFHGAGIVPVDVHDMGCDFYTTGVLKWLCGGPGLAFLYARRDLLPRLEHGTPPAPVAFLAQGGLDIISEAGPAAIRARMGELSDRVIAEADELGLEIRTLRDRNARGGLVNVKVGEEARKICHALLDRDVCTDYRGDGLRVSPHFF